ncbi:MAG: hypothetical protein Rhirs2KO_28770 [Rhizobiaceae bacterium]
MAPASMALTTSVLFAAGLYQFTPSKKACLRRCWYPRWVFASDDAGSGAMSGLREGLVQGWVCLGCCWALMLVMFAVGIMNIFWMALIGLFAIVEKTGNGRVIGRIAGTILLVWAATLLVIST